MGEAGNKSVHGEQPHFSKDHVLCLIIILSFSIVLRLETNAQFKHCFCKFMVEVFLLVFKQCLLSSPSSLFPLIASLNLLIIVAPQLYFIDVLGS